MPRRLAILLAALLFAPDAARALQPESAPVNALGLAPAEFERLQARVASATRLRVRAGANDTVLVRAVLTPDSLLAEGDSTGARALRVALRQVERIEVRGGSAGRGAVIGGVAGAIAGGAAALAYSGMDLFGGGSEADPGAGLAGAFAGAAVGAGLGAAIGSGVRRWHTAWAR